MYELVQNIMTPREILRTTQIARMTQNRVRTESCAYRSTLAHTCAPPNHAAIQLPPCHAEGTGRPRPSRGSISRRTADIVADSRRVCKERPATCGCMDMRSHDPTPLRAPAGASDGVPGVNLEEAGRPADDQGRRVRPVETATRGGRVRCPVKRSRAAPA